MKRMPSEQPTEHYDERVFSIDEQLCSLLRQRKDISNDNPGFPPEDVISKWALKYDLYEDYLRSLFWSMRMDDFFKPRIEPTGFRKHISVLKSIEKDDQVYSVTVIRQYENASVIQLHIDWDEAKDLPDLHHHNTFELFLGEQYDCWQDRAGGSTGHYTYNFIVSPPLPDYISSMDLVFKEYRDTFKENPTGLEIVINIE
ncbi:MULTISPECIES: hypothetical protein [Peribacillus]|uniref:hypothetical protein n=1 Tax=Peribacillus TaxID=2675229 RepID=UPI000BA52F5A|nr:MULTISPECIES: hypothetical protein [Peribacillus]MBD8591675.1 hypothetical protein [Peribacillus simplex]MCM3169624.1 hypothetical protein [Peribacillus frigoritolerans]MEE3955764.1 hypothetical protein [Peribacillus frigoritolerans]PAL04627.1 hypothetical protein B8W99_26740 [Peribacillus simplex]